MSNRAIHILIGLFIAVILFNAYTDRQLAQAGECNARCWYVKYKKEQRRSARLQQQRDWAVIRERVTRRRIMENRGALALSIIKWEKLRHCETKGVPRPWTYGPQHPTARKRGWSGFYGGVQFTSRTWKAFGGRHFARQAHLATPVQQVAIAEKVLKKQGRNAWPVCTRKGAW